MEWLCNMKSEASERRSERKTKPKSALITAMRGEDTSRCVVAILAGGNNKPNCRFAISLLISLSGVLDSPAYQSSPAPQFRLPRASSWILRSLIAAPDRHWKESVREAAFFVSFWWRRRLDIQLLRQLSLFLPATFPTRATICWIPFTRNGRQRQQRPGPGRLLRLDSGNDEQNQILRAESLPISK